MSVPGPDDGALLVVAEVNCADLADAGWRLHDASVDAEERGVQGGWSMAGVAVRTDDPTVAVLVLARAGCAVFTGPAEKSDLVADDARRLGAGIWDPIGNPGDAGGEEPGANRIETEVLMERLAAGDSIAAAARAAHMSLRTAQRRLATIREQHGVPTTAGAVAAWARQRSGRASPRG